MYNIFFIVLIPLPRSPSSPLPSSC